MAPSDSSSDPTASDDLLAYVYGELSAADALAFERRMAEATPQGAALRAEAEGLRASRELFAQDRHFGMTSGADVAPAHLVQAIMNAEALARSPAIRQGTAAATVQQSFAAKLSRWLLGGGLAVGAAAAVLVVINTARSDHAFAPMTRSEQATAAVAPEPPLDLPRDPRGASIDESGALGGLALPASEASLETRKRGDDLRLLDDVKSGETPKAGAKSPPAKAPSGIAVDGAAGDSALGAATAKDADKQQEKVDGKNQQLEASAEISSGAVMNASKAKRDQFGVTEEDAPKKSHAPKALDQADAAGAGVARGGAGAAPPAPAVMAPAPPPATISLPEAAPRSAAPGVPVVAPAKPSPAEPSAEPSARPRDRLGAVGKGQASEESELSVVSPEELRRRRTVGSDGRRTANRGQSSMGGDAERGRRLEQSNIALASAEREAKAKRWLSALDQYANAETLDHERALGATPLVGQMRVLIELKRPADAARVARRLGRWDLKSFDVPTGLLLGAQVAEEVGDERLARELWTRLLGVPAHKAKATAALQRLGEAQAVRQKATSMDAEAPAPIAD